MKQNYTSSDLYAADPLGSARHGAVYAANVAEIAAALTNIEAANDANAAGFHLSQPLTQFIAGVPDEDGVETALNAIAPIVPADEMFSYLVHNEAEAFQADSQIDLARPMGGEFPVIQRRGTQATGAVQHKGLTVYLDERQGGMNPLVQQMAVQSLRNRILRGELVFTMALIDGAAVQADSVNWGLTTSDPDSDIEGQIELSGDARGVESNLVIFGGGVSLKRKRAYRQAGRTNGSDLARSTLAELAEQYEVDAVINNKLRKHGAGDALGKLAGSKVWTLNVKRGAMMDDPSNIKRFVKMGTGGAFNVFIGFEANRVKITVSHYSAPIITSSVGIRALPVTYTNA